MHGEPNINVADLLKAIDKLPKVDVVDVNDTDYLAMDRPYFGDNFYVLFLITLFPEIYPDFDRLYPTREVKGRWGEKWDKFIMEDQDLMSRMRSVLEDFLVYRDLIQLMYDNRAAFDSIEASLGSLGLDAIYIPIRKKMDTILREAFGRMKALGMDPEYFCTPGTY